MITIRLLLIRGGGYCFAGLLKAAINHSKSFSQTEKIFLPVNK